MKGQEKLIYLLSKQSELAKKTHTIFIGGGSKYKYLKDLVHKNGISNKVTFTEKYQEDVLKYISFSDILVFLSVHPRETFGLVILEGDVNEKPVVVLNHGGMVEAVQHNKNGFIVNDEEIEKALTTLVNNKNLRLKMGQEGRKLIDTKFNNLNMAKETVKEQKELCVD